MNDRPSGPEYVVDLATNDLDRKGRWRDYLLSAGPCKRITWVGESKAEVFGPPAEPTWPRLTFYAAVAALVALVALLWLVPGGSP